jgi:hypothetical protein
MAARDAFAVILTEDPGRNTSPPTADQGLAAWNLEATWGGFLATPIDGQYFIAAQHIFSAQTAINTPITFQNQTYQIDPTFNGGLGYADDPGSDLRIMKIVGTFPTYAKLYNAAIDGPEVQANGSGGKPITVIGRGTDRGAEVTVNGVLKGWQWGARDGATSWGQNVVSGLYGFKSPNSMLTFDFNRDGVANEGGLSVGDSSGGVFIKSGNDWKLAGINYGVDGPWSYTGDPSDPGFNADIFDARGLYYKSNGTWTLFPTDGTPAAGAGYASRISSRLDWISSVDPGVGSPSGNVVPEPGTLALWVAGMPLLLVFGWRLRRGRHAA